jgi:hypothetical protein
MQSARRNRNRPVPPTRERITQNQVTEWKQQVTPATRFRDRDARDLDLSRFAWTGEDFTNCDLRGANLSGCNFTGANFERAELWNADLSGSDLTGVTTLLPEQLAATNLKRAKLPDPLSKFEPLEASTKLADNASKVFLTMLSAVAFTFLTLATTKDWQLITNSGNNKLPVIGSDIAIRDFYWAIPVVLLALFIYFHLYLQRLWEALATLPAVFPDGRRLDERSHPWLLTDIVRRSFPRSRVKPPALSRLQTVISVVLGYFVVPVTLAFIWWRLLPLRDGRIIGFQLAMLAGGVGFAFCFLGNLRKTLQAEALKVLPIGRFVRSLTIGQGIPAGVPSSWLACAFRWPSSRVSMPTSSARTFMERSAEVPTSKTPTFSTRTSRLRISKMLIASALTSQTAKSKKLTWSIPTLQALTSSAPTWGMPTLRALTLRALTSGVPAL